MTDFTPWPDDLAQRYRQKGYWLDAPLTRGLETQARARPEACAIRCGARAISYGALDRMATALARRLLARGLRPGDTALVQLPNRAEFFVTFLALLKAGITPVNALFSHRALELRSYAEQLRPRLLIAARSHPLFHDDRFAAELRARSDRLALCLYLDDPDPAQDLAAWAAPDGAEDGGAEDGGAEDAGPLPRIDPGAVAFFQLSGGSTGTPKLIPRTHADYDYSIRASAEICALTPDTVFLCALPAPHNYVLSSPGALGVFHAGGTVVMAPTPEPQLCFELIARHRVTMVALVPSAVGLWLEAVRGGLAAPESLALLQVGGASFAEALARQVPELLGCALQQVFGMAEGLVNYTRLDDPPERIFTTQGRPISPDDEIRVRDATGRDCAPGETGQLWVRGPYTFRGYFRSPAQNAAAFDAEGFYHSGDLVQRDAAGYLRVVGRVKDQINRGGEKIAAEEIEALLLRHPEVMQAALVSEPDPRLGERSCACLVLRQPLRPVVLRRHLIAAGVADYKLPDRFAFLDAMPLTPVGKIDKRALRAAILPAADAPQPTP
ncbi:(2,3-dihydroxybenzoyl)adenylate synthase [Rhodobacter capsulatus]|uniref:(2,3-dihydroxybenzoyl)adenylate synthase n=1 Tax=Rhodobacter capsulatus TaxID=1061 RepID=A0A4U1JL51_RHOCA|nr:(2,3-dihydroxybenzoyl)adenylate synthase [Rhodobacter capsulatus]TKD13412.1 (2,3-dihydroxybenzoyl)adenylate synthase [Rhodobacter capsulatus]